MQENQWTPKEVRKLVILIFGILTFFVGIYLMINQIKAEGSLDINTNFLKGKIQSGSAGLFICFFSMIFILVTTIQFNKKDKSITDHNFFQSGVNLVGLFLATLIIILVLLISFLKTPPVALTAALLGFGFVFFMVLVAKADGK